MSEFPISPPVLNLDLVPEAEREATWVFGTTLREIAGRVNDFKAALDLFDLSKYLAANNFLNQQYRAWQRIALRDGAMTIYHFGRSLKEGSGNGLKECPRLRSLLISEHLHRARRMFSRKFPKAERVRHGAAHSAEITESKANFDANSFSGNTDGLGLIQGNASKLLVQNVVSDRHYVTTHQGEIVRYELSAETFGSLGEIAREFYLAFDDVERFPRRIRNPMTAPRGPSPPANSG